MGLASTLQTMTEGVVDTGPSPSSFLPHSAREMTSRQGRIRELSPASMGDASLCAALPIVSVRSKLCTTRGAPETDERVAPAGWCCGVRGTLPVNMSVGGRVRVGATAFCCDCAPWVAGLHAGEFLSTQDNGDEGTDAGGCHNWEVQPVWQAFGGIVAGDMLSR